MEQLNRSNSIIRIYSTSYKIMILIISLIMKCVCAYSRQIFDHKRHSLRTLNRHALLIEVIRLKFYC